MSAGAGGRRGVFSIGAVARMLDLVAMIRNWEERYAAVVPERSASGRRLYARDQVEQLRYVASQVARGLSPADAHRLLAEHVASEPRTPSDEPGDRTRPLMLIAERDPVAAERAQAVLRGEGHEIQPVLAASDAEERWLERRARLAIVELMISGGQGIDLCRRLKRHDVGAVLAISGLEAREAALAAGADGFLHKPIDPLEFVSTVGVLLAASPRGGA